MKPKALISANWYSQAVNGSSEKNKRSVATISRTGLIAYAVLLAFGAWDSTFGASAGAEIVSRDGILFMGGIFGLLAFFLFHFTVKNEDLAFEDDV